MVNVNNVYVCLDVIRHKDVLGLVGLIVPGTLLISSARPPGTRYLIQ